MLEEQMELFADEGGLKDDGMNKDPISGNEVPSGSLAEEVRDDIPAQLSEGEYVVPADVVRFFGVKFFEDLRMQAKQGLAQMEKDGRIGGEPVAVATLEVQADADQLDPEDEKKLREMMKVNKGGVIHAAEGVLAESDITADTIAKSTNPLGDYGFVGGSLGFPSRAIPTQKTFYHPDGRTYVIRYDADGSLSNPNDAVYTESPWSETPPNIQQIATGTGGDASVFDDREESSNRERESSVSQTTQAFTDMQKARVDADKALEDSYTRLMKNNPTLKLTQSQYSNLPLSAKIGLIPAELGLDVKDSDINAIINNANNPTGLGKLISALGGGVVGAVANAAKSIFTGIGEALNFESADQTVQQVVDSDSDGLMNRVDRFLLGIKKDNKIQTPQGPVDINSSEGKAAIGRIEENRKRVRDKALETHLKEVDNLRVDLQQAEESAGQGDLDTVAQNKAFDQQMQEAVAQARGTTNRREDANMSGTGGATSGFGSINTDVFGPDPGVAQSYGGSGGYSDYGSDFGIFTPAKGGLASKPKAKAKRKKNTKGLGTKPKAT